MRYILIFLLAFFAYSTPFTYAQDGSMIYGNQSLSIDLEPLYPSPEEPFTATINDYALSAQGVGIHWLVDGKLLADKNNERKISLTAKTVGKPTVIEAVIDLAGGMTVSVKKVIDPVYLDIIIEPQTRTPAFYKGRALPSIDSLINATALVNGNAISPSDLLYTWKLNQSVLEGGTLRGKNHVTFSMPRGRYATLILEVHRPGGETIARRIFDLPSISPTLSFYETSPLYGLNTRTIRDSVSLIGSSLSVRAEPYNLDLRTFNNPDFLEWKLNGTQSPGEGNNPYEITLATAEQGLISGATNINFHVRNTAQVLQGAESSFRVNY